MLRFQAHGSSQTCDGISRRDFLEVGSLGAVGLSLPQLLAAKAEAGLRQRDNRSAILIFNLGAPSQLDTWDPKPHAPSEIRGPFQAISTAAPGLELTELFPQMAQWARHFSVVRTCHHDAAAVHDTGHQLLQTGRLATGSSPESPHAGCVLGYLRGSRRGLPPHVLLPEPMGATGGNMPHGQTAGFLGSQYDPCTPHLADIQAASARRLRSAVERSVDRLETQQHPALADPELSESYRLLTTREARSAFDLSREPRAIRERYGLNRFGQNCLLARRLVEAGVRFVTVNTFVTVFDQISWDIHGTAPFSNVEDMQRVVAPMYDQAYSALLEDLVGRGLLDDTLVASLAEFGRTPKINPSGGRDHWPQCWSVQFAGGGIQGGRVVGTSDALAAEPVDRPVTPAEIVATMYHSLGIDPATQLPGPDSQNVPLVNEGASPIQELF